VGIHPGDSFHNLGDDTTAAGRMLRAPIMQLEFPSSEPDHARLPLIVKSVTMSDAEAQQTLQRLMLFAQTSRENFQTAADVGRQLTHVDKSQKLIIEELATSIPSPEDIGTKLRAADEEIASLDSQLSQVQAELIARLSSKSSSKKGPEDILRALLTTFQSVLFALSKESAEKGQTIVSLLSIIQLEDQISSTIDDLTDRGLYLEESSETQTRVDRRESHARKLVDFLTVLQKRMTLDE
jgi:hypothetical protein